MSNVDLILILEGFMFLVPSGSIASAVSSMLIRYLASLNFPKAASGLTLRLGRRLEEGRC